MAIFHLRSTIIQRSHGRSTLAAAAYRAGMKLEDRRQCLTFNYERRKHVAYREIYTPANAPEWMSEREELWNFVEAQEKRKDSQLAREFVLSLPHELTRNEQLQLLERYVRKEFVSRGLLDVPFLGVGFSRSYVSSSAFSVGGFRIQVLRHRGTP